MGGKKRKCSNLYSISKCKLDLIESVIKMRIVFNKPFVIGKEFQNIEEAITREHLSGDGFFTANCNNWLESTLMCHKALLTHSCTAALEMAAILVDIQPGDEVIMPSYTFVSTANAFVLRGGIPVFVDIRPDTLNIDETKIEQAITERTKVIVPVHYAGVPCEMNYIMKIAERYNLMVVEDAAQGLMSTYEGRALGSIGHLGTLSFHETKNIISGEGGALLINDPHFVERAEIIREKGTNRSKFFRGEVDKYTWVDIGSSYLPSEMIAAFLWAQMEKVDSITASRHKIWNCYHEGFIELEKQGIVRRPIIPDNCKFNAHLYYLLFANLETRTKIISYLKKKDIHTVFHYVPLHNSPAGKKYGKTCGSLEVTEQVSECLVRLPLWIGMDQEMVDRVISEVINAVTSL